LAGKAGSKTRIPAIVALGRIGDPAALPVLREAQKDSDEDVSEAAAAAIQQIESRGAKKE
jgi:HEAT repeat protein